MGCWLPCCPITDRDFDPLRTCILAVLWAVVKHSAAITSLKALRVNSLSWLLRFERVRGTPWSFNHSEKRELPREAVLPTANSKCGSLFPQLDLHHQNLFVSKWVSVSNWDENWFGFCETLRISLFFSLAQGLQPMVCGWEVCVLTLLYILEFSHVLVFHTSQLAYCIFYFDFRNWSFASGICHVSC